MSYQHQSQSWRATAGRVWTRPFCLGAGLTFLLAALLWEARHYQQVHHLPVTVSTTVILTFVVVATIAAIMTVVCCWIEDHFEKSQRLQQAKREHSRIQGAMRRIRPNGLYGSTSDSNIIFLHDYQRSGCERSRV